MTYRGPITTVFTPSSSCLTNAYFIDPADPGLFVYQGSGLFLYHWAGIPGGSGCYPSTAPLTGVPDWDYYYYSPAICPSGWRTATSLTTISLGGPSMGPGTSGYLCCPLQFVPVVTSNNIWQAHECYSELSSGQPVTYTPVLTGVLSQVITTTASSGLTIFCDGIPIVWETTDLEILALITSSTLAAESSTSTSSTPSPTNSASPGSTISSSNRAPTSSSTSPSAQSGSGLSTGAKAGIAIGVIIIVGLASLGIFFILRKRRKERKKPSGKASESGIGKRGPPELFTKSNTPELLGKETTNAGTHEILGKGRTGAELLTASNAHEILGKETANAQDDVPAVPPKVPIPPPKELVPTTVHELPHGAAPPKNELDSEFSALNEMDPQAQAYEIRPESVTRAELEAQRAIEISGSTPSNRAESFPSSSSHGLSISRKPVQSWASPEPNNATGGILDSEDIVRTDEQEEAKMAVLRDRIERIREDRERLEQIQRLREMEEETKAEIMAATRRSRPK